MEHEHAASLTARAVKKALPERAIVTKDARATLNSAASMFTLYLTAAAQDNSARHKRQTITLNDVLQALKDVDLEHFTGPIEDCLTEAKEAAAKKKARKEAEMDDGVADQEANGEDEQEDEDPLAEAVATDEDAALDEDEAMESAEEEPLPQEHESAAMSDRETATEEEQKEEEEKIELEEDRIDEDPVPEGDNALE